jgi:hypothetical protein
MADPHTPAAHDAYVHGSQEINEQVSTFHAFVLLAKWGSLVTACILLFLVMWFAPNGSFFGGLIAAVVLGAAGWWFLHERKPAH